MTAVVVHGSTSAAPVTHSGQRARTPRQSSGHTMAVGRVLRRANRSDLSPGTDFATHWARCLELSFRRRSACLARSCLVVPTPAPRAGAVGALASDHRGDDQP